MSFMSILEVQNISYTYPDNGINAVKNISFSISHGDYIAVLGTNGSGKSTLARLIAQFLEPDSGKIIVPANTKIGIVFQSPEDQIVSSIVETDTAFGPKNLKLSQEEILDRTNKSLQSVGLFQEKKEKTAFLSQGQKQKLALAGIMALNPDILILDESTAMLDPVSRKNILDLLDQWNAQGKTLIHITHDIDEAKRAKFILAMENGNVIFSGNRKIFIKSIELEEKLFGKQLSARSKTNKQNSGNNTIVLKFENINFSYSNNNVTKNLFKDFSLEIPQGKLIALMGPSGCGKSTFLELTAGLLIPNSGEIYCSGKIALALQNSEHALFEEFAADDVAFGAKNQGYNGTELVEIVKNAMNTVDLPFSKFAERKTFSLSGGEKRKLALAGIIALNTEILLFDEPTAGLDPKSRNKIMEVLQKLCEQGKTVIFSTHRIEESLLADEIIHFEATQPIKIKQDSKQTDFIQDPDLKPREKLNGLSLLSFLKNCTASFFAGTNYKKEKKPLVQKFPAIIKYVLFLTLFVLSFLTKNVFLASSVTVTTFLYAILAGFSVFKLLKSIFKILPWILIFFFIQILFLPTNPADTILFSIGSILITTSKLNGGILMLLHLISAFTTLATFVYSITEQEILDGLEQLLTPLTFCRIPTRHITLTVSIVFRFIPLLADEASLIIKTQLIRGGLGQTKGLIKKIKMVIPLIVPLFIRTIKRSEILADALIARFYT